MEVPRYTDPTVVTQWSVIRREAFRGHDLLGGEPLDCDRRYRGREGSPGGPPEKIFRSLASPTAVKVRP